MRTKLWLLVPFVLASVALAQVVGVQGAKGEGVAVNEIGRRGSFRFDVVKYFTASGRTEVDGPLRFESGPYEGRRIVIEMAHAHVFAKSENVAEFGGPAILVAHTDLGDRRIEGRIAVRVQDNRRPTDPNTQPHDLFSIRFFNTNATVVYQFAGRVGLGDLVVYQRRT